MPNLFPDMEVAQYQGSEDFIYAAPIGPNAWDILHRASRRPTRLAFDIRLYRTEDTWSGRSIVILLAEPRHTKDFLLEVGAHLRIVEGIVDRIYCVPRALDDRAPPPSMYAGARGDLCAMFELPS